MDEKLYGSLETGKKADLIVIDPHGPSMMPVNDKIAALVTAMHSANIQSTMCDGKWLMRDRKILVLDEEAILKEACARGAAIYDRPALSCPTASPWSKWSSNPLSRPHGTAVRPFCLFDRGQTQFLLLFAWNTSII